MTTILHRRSSDPGKTPTTSDLELGELAINTYDGKVYLKRDNGAEEVIDLTEPAPYLKITSDTLAVKQTKYLADTSAGFFSFTLPAAPQIGEWVTVADGGDFETYPLLVLRNGHTIDNTTDDLAITIPGAHVDFIFNGQTWCVSFAIVGNSPDGGSFIGFTGSQGFMGSQGLTGFTGSQGDVGFTGLQGAIGFTGSRGATGFTGSQGFNGSQGVTGFVGSQGVTGFVGSQGFTGSQGAGFTGSQGVTGFVGSQGDLGYTGSQGAGFTGSQGVTGFTGSTPSMTSFSRKLFSGVGPAAAGTSASVETTMQTLTIPANTLEVGDTLIVRVRWRHAGSAQAPRYGLKFGASYVVSLTSTAATDLWTIMEARIGIAAVSGSNAQISSGWLLRDNSTYVGMTHTNPAETLSGAINLSFQYRFDAGAETAHIDWYDVWLEKKP